MDFQNMTFGSGLLVSAFCMLIVFTVLVCIAYLVDITAFLANRKAKKLEKELPVLPVNPDPETEEVDSKLVAVAMAALSAYSGSDTRFIIRKIDRQKAPLSDWEAAGLRDSVRRPT